LTPLDADAIAELPAMLFSQPLFDFFSFEIL
jgi:hypothetical protein